MVMDILAEQTLVVREEGDVMALIRNKAETLPKLLDAYQNGGSDMVLQSLNFRQYQDDIIAVLAQDSAARGKADVVRRIIDEWVEWKLREAGLL